MPVVVQHDPEIAMRPPKKKLIMAFEEDFEWDVSRFRTLLVMYRSGWAD